MNFILCKTGKNSELDNSINGSISIRNVLLVFSKILSKMISTMFNKLRTHITRAKLNSKNNSKEKTIRESTTLIHIPF